MFQGLRFMIADLAMKLEAARQLTHAAEKARGRSASRRRVSSAISDNHSKLRVSHV
jgi:alkylation response protein AidB-like acyl-CoA dehydrogenase